MEMTRAEQNHRYYMKHRAERARSNRCWHAEHPDYNRGYYAAHPIKEEERIQRWRTKNPEAVRAHRLVKCALYRGILKKAPYCQLCLKGSHRLDAHHPDYSRPLDVIFCCRACHVGLHASCIEQESVVH